jgi:hypothetical protein
VEQVEQVESEVEPVEQVEQVELEVKQVELEVEQVEAVESEVEQVEAVESEVEPVEPGVRFTVRHACGGTDRVAQVESPEWNRPSSGLPRPIGIGCRVNRPSGITGVELEVEWKQVTPEWTGSSDPSETIWPISLGHLGSHV